MTKYEQLRRVFTKEIKRLADDKCSVMVGNIVYPVEQFINTTVDMLLKEVEIRTNLRR